MLNLNVEYVEFQLHGSKLWSCFRYEMSLNDLSDEADSPGGVHSDIDNVAFPALNGTGYDDTRSFSNFQSDDSRGEPNCPTTSKYRRIEEGLVGKL